MGGRGAQASGAEANGVEGSSGTTKALVDALRAFSSEKWWQVGSGDGAQEALPRRRAKPEEFQRNCAEKHAEMKKIYESTMMQDSEQRWLRKVSSEGTSGDRVASLTMLIQVCPVFATGHIKALLGMAGKTERSDSIMAMDGLKDLFIGTLLPDRKLRTLGQMDPLSPKGLSKASFTELCVVAYFEDYLKTAFAAFVQIISEIAHSTVVFFKSKAIRTAYELLVAKPEQERALLGLLVNKFGDLAPKVSSNASQCIKKLVEAHPAMKSVVVREVESFLARPNITQKSRYFALLYLSEVIYSRKDGELAAQLVRLFVTQLEVALRGGKGRKGRRWQPALGARRPGSGLVEDDNRLIRTLVSGIQRALPYLTTTTAGGSPLQGETVDALFRVGHTVSAFSTRIAVMGLLFRCLSAQGAPDRFFRLVHEQISHFELFTCAHRLQALLLLRRSVPADTCCTRAVALARRLLQLGACAEPPLAAAALGLLRELLAARKSELSPMLKSLEAELRQQAPEEGAKDMGPEEEHFGDDDKEAKAAPQGGARDGVAKERYNPTAREPRYARARLAPLWELYALSSHVHPSVAHNASKLLSSGTFEDSAENPFEQLACSELLEQFVSSSRAQRGQQKEGKARVPFNTERFSKRKNVAPHERFIQHYFQDATVREMKNLKDARKKKSTDEVDEEGGQADDAEEDGAEEDAFFTKYLEDQMPKDEGDEDDDPDIDDSDDEEGEDEPGFGSDGDGDSDAGMPEGEEEEAADSGSGDDAEGPKKRSLDEASFKERGGAKKRRKTLSGSTFASAEDFEHLLAEDAA